MNTFLEYLEEKKSDPCWPGYKRIGNKDKNGKSVPNCVPEDVEYEVGDILVMEDDSEWEVVTSEAEYQGKEVPLNKPLPGDIKKSKVFVKNAAGKVVKVNFGDPEMSIKKHIPANKKSYCARSGGIDGPNDKTSANYWSRKAWDC